MDKQEQVELLQKIADTGDCDHVRHYECKSCPLGRWKKNPNGTFMSCLEATNAIQNTLKHPDGYKEAYREAATEVLCELAILELLGDESESSS